MINLFYLPPYWLSDDNLKSNFMAHNFELSIDPSLKRLKTRIIWLLSRMVQNYNCNISWHTFLQDQKSHLKIHKLRVELFVYFCVWCLDAAHTNSAWVRYIACASRYCSLKCTVQCRVHYKRKIPSSETTIYRRHVVVSNQGPG